MRIIPTGIEIEKFKRPDITRECARRTATFSGDSAEQMLLLSLSRISYEKNIQQLFVVEIFWRFSRHGFWFVGKGLIKKL